MRTPAESLELSRGWIHRNACPVDLARWRYHFERGPREDVLGELAYYQNANGGFGHALEADAWNPDSSPIQTWAATEILRETGADDREHPVIQGILRYLDSGKGFAEGVWQNTIPSNNDHPHAFWWTWETNTRHYNPTASLCGFIIKHADKTSALFEKGVTTAKEAIEHFINTENKDDTGDEHLKLCYIRLIECCREAGEAGRFDIPGLRKALTAHINIDTKEKDMAWLCDGVVFEFMKYYQNELGLIANNPGIINSLRDYLLENQNGDGSWNIPWSWNVDAKSWAISEHWWKAHGIIAVMLFFKRFGLI